MKKEQIEALLRQYLDGQISEADRRQLVELVTSNSEQEGVTAALQALLETTEGDPLQVPPEWNKLPALITAIDKNNEVVPIRAQRAPFYRRWYWAAAAILVLLGTGAYLWIQQLEKPERYVIQPQPLDDALPGKQGAILTLADGSKVVLDSLANGTIATQGNTAVKLNNGQVLYEKGDQPAAVEMTYNTMATPKGRQYQLVLPDGTKVWLNAASSLTYPTAFIGKERKVAVTGEAYFEVAKNVQQPFRVTVDENTTIEVLGTHFNVNAYSDEASINTTLLEGAVKVIHNNANSVLKPGEQAQVKNDIKVISDADVEQVMAWKNGLFSFDDADIQTVMRQLARWYNVEVEYAGKIPSGEFNGEIGKGLTLTQVLRVLTTTRIKYRIENGDRIIILPD